MVFVLSVIFFAFQNNIIPPKTDIFLMTWAEKGFNASEGVGVVGG